MNEEVKESLYDKLIEHNKNQVYPMHMPGHKRNTQMMSMVNPYSIDITEIDGFDNMHSPTGIIKDIIDKELAGVRRKVDEIAEESIERAKDTTERQMDRITNEKMMAINEYSDTVMTEIHKNHEEAVFLYDMLTNKHAQVKTTAAELNQTIKLSKQTQSAAKAKGTDKKKEVDKQADTPTVKLDFEPITAEYVNEAENKDFMSEEPVVRDENVTESVVPDTSGIEMMFASDSSEANSNEQIIKLHKAGKSNMAIARELGLGIGEVKLVIDLFEGGM
jgi:hypothetical protein